MKTMFWCFSLFLKKKTYFKVSGFAYFFQLMMKGKPPLKYWYYTLERIKLGIYDDASCMFYFMQLILTFL